MPGIPQDQSVVLPPLFISPVAKIVINTTTETSCVPTTGTGSMTIPANTLKANSFYKLEMLGSYQTPAVPGAVTVKIYFGTVVLASVTVTASILAAGSAQYELYGEANIMVVTTGATGTMTCNGYMSFRTATVAQVVPFSTAMTTGSPSATATVNTTIANLVDLTSTWSNAQAGQGTTIVQTKLSQEG